MGTKVDVSVDVSLSEYDIKKKIDIAKKYYASGEGISAVEVLEGILKHEPFHKEVLELVLEYIFDTLTDSTIVNMKTEIIKYINHLKTLKTTKDDEKFIDECEEYLNDSCKRYYCKLGFIIGGGVIVYFLILLLIGLIVSWL